MTKKLSNKAFVNLLDYLEWGGLTLLLDQNAERLQEEIIRYVRECRKRARENRKR